MTKHPRESESYRVSIHENLQQLIAPCCDHIVIGYGSEFPSWEPIAAASTVTDEIFDVERTNYVSAAVDHLTAPSEFYCFRRMLQESCRTHCDGFIRDRIKAMAGMCESLLKVRASLSDEEDLGG